MSKLVIMTFWNDLPSRNIATIAVFYALPVIQLVITYQTVYRWHLLILNMFFFCVLGNELKASLFFRW